jgi:erythromycin esterase-like protein
MISHHSSSVVWPDRIRADLARHAYSLPDESALEPLYDEIGDSRIVMLGEASHGTHEYYTWRSYISRKLIEEKGFQLIAVEGDWPDCYKLNRYIKGYVEDGKSALDILHAFNRWPTWMWANWEIVALAEYLRKRNEGYMANQRVGFYGLDVYSLWESMESIMSYLQKTDPKAFKTAVTAFRCFEPYKEDEGRAYARASRLVPDLCRDEVVDLLTEIRNKMPLYNSDYENVFSAEQNALIAVNAEKYYRAMMEGGPHAWNVRDRHMADTLNRLLEFHGDKSKVIVWEHNTHIGDARATDMAEDGMFNIGELARVEHPGEVFLIGFGSYRGSVMAGKGWGAPMQKMNMPPAQKGSWEHLLHSISEENKLIFMHDLTSDPWWMEHYIGHRAIGVVYHPSAEYGNYVPTILPMRYDAFIFLDETQALHPIHIIPHGRQIPETYPFGV